MTSSTVTLKIDEPLRHRVKRIADARKRTPHWLMREAITTYVEREEAEEALRQEALAAWEEYQATGLHVTQEEMSAWLQSIGTEHELPPPECHL